MIYHYFGTDFNIKENSFLAKLAAKKLKSKNVAMVIGNTIHLHGVTKELFLQNTSWLKHELCHIKQYRQYGTMNFLAKYLLESAKVGYYNNKYEVEARKAEQL